jgi:hypothetical protein
VTDITDAVRAWREQPTIYFHEGSPTTVQNLEAIAARWGLADAAIAALEAENKNLSEVVGADWDGHVRDHQHVAALEDENKRLRERVQTLEDAIRISYQPGNPTEPQEDDGDLL